MLDKDNLICWLRNEIKVAHKECLNDMFLNGRFFAICDLVEEIKKGYFDIKKDEKPC